MSDTVARAGRTYARFDLRRVLGAGAYGTVYEAFDRERRELVAVKELSRVSPRALADFKTEFRALADLSHPNLVQLYELIEHEGRWLIVMELVDGMDFDRYVARATLDPDNANAPCFREDRLRACLAQLAEGLDVLHDAGLVHRDLKPPNLRVTPAGRLVLLDFGLVTDADQDEVSHSVVGSAGYMAPEQAQAGRVGPAADWYAVGCVLYEALTGSLPFAGNSLAVVLAKQRERPAPPSARAPHIPRDLEQLCTALLERDPARRAGSPEVRRACRRAVPGDTSLRPPSSAAPFAGRERELDVLERAFAEACAGRFRAVLVQGESGVGKTALVAEAARRLRSRAPEALILRGRCFELEAAPFKGFDGIVDALARALSRRDVGEVQRLLPAGAWRMAALFPVLDGLCAPEGTARLSPRDPSVLRRAALECLFSLLGGVAQRAPLVLVLDDLQWADAETLRVIEELAVRAGLPGMLWILTCRPDPELEPPVRHAKAQLSALEGTRLVQLAGLAPAEARELAAQLLGVPFDARWGRLVADAANGHPLLIEELARHVRQDDPREGDALTLEVALRARVAALGPQARELLELVVLAGSPRPLSLFAVAMGTRSEALAPAVGELRARRLLLAGRSGRVRCFHDRLRYALFSTLSEAGARQRHAQLARAFEADGADPADAALHWEHAGELERALPLLEAAGLAAQRALAFDLAAAFFAMLLERAVDRDQALAQRARVWRADALSAAGRNLDAGRAYLDAARLGPVEDRTSLLWRAAQHLLQGAEVGEGLEVLAEVFASLGLPLPRSSRGAFLRMMWHRLVLGLRGLDAPLRDRSELSVDDLRRLQLLHDLSPVLTWIEIFRGAELGARHLRVALSTGDRTHIVMALAAEALMHAIQDAGPSERARRLLQRARGLSRPSDPARGRAFVHLCAGQTIHAQWRVAEAYAELSRAEALYQQDPRVDWHQVAGRTFSLGLLGLCGRYEEHGACVERWLSEARARADRFASSNYILMGLACYRHLRNDRPERALEEVKEALELWPVGQASMPQFGAFYAVGAVLSYSRDWASALAHNDRWTRRLLRSWLAYPRFARGGLLIVRALVLLGAAAERAPGAERDALLAQAGRIAARMGRVHKPTASLMPMVLGQAAVLRGAPEQARAPLEQGLARCQELGAQQWGRQARVALACCDGPAARDAALEREAAWLEEQGFVNIERALAWLYPVAFAQG